MKTNYPLCLFILLVTLILSISNSCTTNEVEIIKKEELSSNFFGVKPFSFKGKEYKLSTLSLNNQNLTVYNDIRSIILFKEAAPTSLNVLKHCQYNQGQMKTTFSSSKKGVFKITDIGLKDKINGVLIICSAELSNDKDLRFLFNGNDIDFEIKSSLLNILKNSTLILTNKNNGYKATFIEFDYKGSFPGVVL